MKLQVFGVGMATIISALGLGLIVWKTNPAVASSLLKASFFVTLFILVWSASTLIIFSIKNRFLKSRLLGETAYESAFSISSLWGLLLSSMVMAVIFIKKMF